MNTAGLELTVLPLPAGDAAAVPVVQVRGDADATSAGTLQAELARLAPGGLIVDLSQARYFDSAGFACLARPGAYW